MVQLGFILWALFLAVLAFSMMPGAITAVIIISFLGGLYDGCNRNKKKKKGFDLTNQERRFWKEGVLC